MKHCRATAPLLTIHLVRNASKCQLRKHSCPGRFKNVWYFSCAGSIRSAARKRFVLGYPPRKPGDTSIGDAINWEWIIHCAQASTDGHHVLIVSRDGDYGITFDGEPILNDWLRSEFKARVSRKRKIELTNKLSNALRKLDEIVQAEDERAEELVLRTPVNIGRFASIPPEQLEAIWRSLDRSLGAFKGLQINLQPEDGGGDSD